MKPFREYHLFKILNKHQSSTLPIDALLRNYFRQNKAVGSKDRKEICEILYGMIRWKGLIDHFCEKPINWEKRHAVYMQLNPEEWVSKEDLPLHVGVSFPKHLFDYIHQAYGTEKSINICFESNFQAPTMVRVNQLKISRDTLFEEWKKCYPIKRCEHAPNGIIFNERINFFGLPEFKAGYFEVQDEGSQIIAELLDVKPKQHVLDYCAGSGGKTLAFAPKMQHKGQIYLYDVREHALYEAKKRLKRAGIQNAQILDEKKLKKKGLLKRMDKILLDVPCSGTGTLRRNPDMKWRFSPEMLQRLITEQRKIFDEVLPYLHPNGTILYATCSLLPEENMQQIEYFIKKYSLKLASDPFQSFPSQGGMDGFFAAILKLS